MPFVQTRDATLFVTEVGSPENPPILFSNSLGTTHRMWDAIIEELATDFRCIRYDTRGHGRSTVASASFDIADLATDTVAILDNLGIRSVHFAGLSLGGMTGQALAIGHPDRLRSLTLMATAAHLPPAQGWLDRAELVRKQGMRVLLEATGSRWFTPEFRSQSSPVLERAMQDFAAIGAEGYAACCEAIARLDLRDDLRRITSPTLVIAGRQDPATPVAMSEALRDSIAGAELVVLDSAAHLLAIEQPAQVAKCLAGAVEAAERAINRP